MTPLDQADVKLLWDMLDSARKVVRYVGHMNQAVFSADDKTRDAVERRVEVIGEAARNVSDAARREIPSVAWKAIVGTRHILAHEYGDIDPLQMHRIATVHVPALVSVLEEVLRGHSPPSIDKDLGTP